MSIVRCALHLSGPTIAVPPTKRLPLGVDASGIGNEPVLLAAAPGSATGFRQLRVTLALDHRAESKVILTDGSGRQLATADIRFGGQFQPYDLELTEEPPHILHLHVVGEPVWLITGDGDDWAEATPHLWTVRQQSGPLASGLQAEPEPEAVALRRLASPICQQQFGWKDGCITDALVDLHRATGEQRFLHALEQRIERFVHDGRLRYENAVCEAQDGRLYGIEGGLPVAALMGLPGGAPLSDLLLRFWREERSSADGTISDGHHLSTEGCYVIAWPLALMARRDRDPVLAAWALRQLEVRRERLVIGDSVWQARNGGDPGRLPGWARGVAWYLLGHVRTVSALDGVIAIPSAIRDEIARVSAWALSHQRADGMWGNFIDDPSSIIDTSGSAGIATGLAHAAALGLIESTATQHAQAAARGLRASITPDGWLSGCAQENKGGDQLQRSAYRVSAPFGLGLWGQLHAVLHDPQVAWQPKDLQIAAQS